MNKYQRLINDLETTGTGSMKCFGNSMLPILSNPSICTYTTDFNPKIGDIVFCKVNGRFIDAHLITKIDGSNNRYMISNNHGHDNGWTRTLYGKVISAKNNSGNIKHFL